jgi:hypothetical protein
MVRLEDGAALLTCRFASVEDDSGTIQANCLLSALARGWRDVLVGEAGERERVLLLAFRRMPQ